jgi:hypothetical protein
MTRMTTKEIDLLTCASLIARLNTSEETPEHKLFKAAYDLIKDERYWCKYHMRQTVKEMEFRAVAVKMPMVMEFVHGSEVMEDLDYTFEIRYMPVYFDQFCTYGALREAARNIDCFSIGKVMEIVINALSDTIGGQRIDQYNDMHTHAEVMGMFHRTAERMGWSL